MDRVNKKDQTVMLILSVIDLVTGILSIVFSILAVQCIATIASGATLAKAVSIIINGEKAAKLGKNGENVGKILVKNLPTFAALAGKIIIKGVIKMKFVDKLKHCVADNPRTIGAVVLETVFGGIGGYGVYEVMQKYADVLVNPWNVIVPIFATILAYALVVIITIKAGYENISEATIRRTAKALGVSEIADMLVSIKQENDEKMAEQEQEAAKEAERKAEEDAIIAAYEAEEREKIQSAKALEEQREAARAEAERVAKINAYKAAHPELFGEKTDGQDDKKE